MVYDYEGLRTLHYIQLVIDHKSDLSMIQSNPAIAEPKNLIGRSVI